MSTTHKFIILATLVTMMLPTPTQSQTKLVLNGADIMIQNGAQLVIENGSSDAIVRTTGSIRSQDDDSVIKWMIGTQTGTYIIPWGNATQYLPVSFDPSGATGTGYFLFGTYALQDWNNAAA